MHTPARHLFVALLALLALGLSACSSDDTGQSDGGSRCPEGQERHPITGACATLEPAPDAAEDLATPQEDMARAPDMQPLDQGGAVDMGVDMAPVEDMGVDMAPTDMGVDMGTQGPRVRFVAIGDTGTGSDMQRKVGQSIGVACTMLGGCDFGMLLGDNAYDSGVSSEMDSRFDDYFTIPYSHLSFPFYVVLGNHDLGGGGLGVDLDWMKGDYQVRYSQLNPQWRMPAKYYQALEGPVWLVGLNTTEVFFGMDGTQRTTVQSWVNAAPEWPWRVAFGHHPYISNGKHGNAGSYDGVPDFIPIASGQNVKSFAEELICGKFDVYLAGHDHSIQDLQAKCGTEFIVSGAGAKTTELKGSNPSHYQSDQEGFVIVEATYTEMTFRFYDADGVLKHQRSIQKPLTRP